MKSWLYVIPFLALLALQTTATTSSNQAVSECRRCTRNAVCNSQNKCVCKPNYIGDPLFHCYHASTCYCRLLNDPDLRLFSGERVVVNTVGSSLVADLTSDRLGKYGGKCYLKLYHWTHRVLGKIYIEGIQFQLAYQDSLGQIYSLEARIRATTDVPVFSTQNQQTCRKAFADVIFLIDSSGSIGNRDYAKQLRFVASFTKNFKLGPQDVRFGVIIFSGRARVEFYLNTFSDPQKLEAAILSLRFLRGLTRTDLALKKILDEDMFSSRKGGRDDAGKLVIVLTDGRSTNPSLTRRQAKNVKDKGIRVIAIGIGNADLAELIVIASSRDDVFRAANFDALNKLEMDLANRTCDDMCVGTYTWQIDVRKAGDKYFQPAQTITSQGTPSDNKFSINKFGCVIEFKRIDAMFLRVEFQCCGVKTAIRAYNPCDVKKRPGIWVLVNKRNNPSYFWPYTVPLCLDHGGFTIANVQNSTGLQDPRSAFSFLSLINGGPVDYPGAPDKLEEMRNALRACNKYKLRKFFKYVGFLLNDPPLINCISTRPGQGQIVYLLLRTAEYYCQRLVPGCNETQTIISNSCKRRIINKNPKIAAFLNSRC